MQQTRTWAQRAFLGLMALGGAMITLASLPYFDSSEVAPFVLERLPTVHFPSIWRRALVVHVVSALASFPLCLVLTTAWLRRHPAAHRWLGRVAGMLLALGLVPSGAVLAFEAKGGPWVTWGFLLSGAIILWALLAGVVAARRRRFPDHARFMRHVVAQMSVAVTSRAMLVAFDHAGVAPDLGYVVALWVPVVGSALVAESLGRPFRLPSFKPASVLMKGQL